MKKITILLFVICCLIQNTSAQAPCEMSYLIMALDPETGRIMADEDVSIRIEIRQGNEEGKAVYSQNFNVHTDKTGVCNLTLNLSADIDWSTNNYYLITIINQTVCSSPKITSVPYALYAGQAASLNGIITAKQLVGTWKNAYNDPKEGEESFIFNADGTGYQIWLNKEEIKIAFTWSLNRAGILAVIDAENRTNVYYTIIVDENKIIIGGDSRRGDTLIRQK